MDYKLYFLLFILLSSCSSGNLSRKQISYLKNKELCQALGMYNKNNLIIYDILEEIEFRKNYLNQRECYIIANKYINSNNNILYNDHENYQIQKLKKNNKHHRLDLKYWNNINKYYHEIVAKKINNLSKNITTK